MDPLTSLLLIVALGAIALVALYYVIRAGVAAGLQLDRDRQAASAPARPSTHLDHDAL